MIRVRKSGCIEPEFRYVACWNIRHGRKRRDLSRDPLRLDYVLLFDFFDDLFCLLLLRDGLSKLIEFDVGHGSLTLGHMQ